MKRALILLALLGLAFSPLMVSQAQAAPAKQHHRRVVRHHKKVVKKHAAKRAVRKHKIAV
ncbi:MAG TPA: hypothetical protein VN761_04250 [Candidatus Polarisedimenticolia bacterium]|nr:hypothetical protein [Candidatus Polarisedimenticolia bacterium]